MRQSIFLTFIAILFLVASCKHDTDIYSFYRESKLNNYKTTKGAELYAFAADRDSVLVRADYYLKMMARLKTYGTKIVAYGFCWNIDSTKVLVGVDTLRTTYKSTLPNEKDTISWFTYSSALTRLSKNTTYFVRSYVITIGSGGATDSVIWYNPKIRKVSTKDAIDQWFLQSGANAPSSGFRFDALAFNLGDTVFFGTGNQGQKNLSNQIYMYDPKKSAWELYATVPIIQLPISLANLSKFSDGIGFAIQFKDNNSGSNTLNKFFYVGLGDYEGGDNRDYKSNSLYGYDLIAKQWYKETADFSGGVRSGAVCFVIGSHAYVGTGSNSGPTNDWHVYSPADDRDGVPTTPAWQVLANIPSPTKRVGAVAFSINDRGYFGLGKDDKGNFLKDFYEFRPNTDNPRNGTWSRKADFPGSARANASAFVIGDQGYVGTGDNIIGDMESNTYSGNMFEDVYRYDPYNNKWHKVANYTKNNEDRIDSLKKVTRGVGFSVPGDNFGYIGFGIVPTADPRAQEDLWQYKPYDVGKK